MIADSSNRVFRPLKITVVLLAIVVLCVTLEVPAARAQTSQTQTSGRKLKVSPPPEYPELARKMNIQGLVRVLLTVSTDGSVVKVKELGGNPVLVSAMVQAVRKWKYESADHDSEIEVRFEFVQNH
jgi:TonB family protein